MSRDKQIEEMTKIIWDNPNMYDLTSAEDVAFALYDAGYRKASVGKWVDVYNGKYANQLYKCSVCGELAYGNGKVWFFSKFCPSCGAEMKGEWCGTMQRMFSL